MPARVVGRGALDQADQHHDLLGGQVAQLAAEPELGTGGGAADLLRAALAQVDLVEEGLEDRSEEHTSELQSLMRISYAVFCLKNINFSRYNIHSLLIYIT